MHEFYQIQQYWERYLNKTLQKAPEGQFSFIVELKIHFRKENGKFKPLDDWSYNKLKDIVSSQWFVENVQTNAFHEEYF